MRQFHKTKIFNGIAYGTNNFTFRKADIEDDYFIAEMTLLTFLSSFQLH